MPKCTGTKVDSAVEALSTKVSAQWLVSASKGTMNSSEKMKNRHGSSAKMKNRHGG